MEVRIHHLVKIIDKKQILNIPFLHFPEKRIIGLLGDNGSGKTTLLNIISGMDRQYEGQILYDSTPLNKKKSTQMGMVNQRPYLFRRSVFENIEYPLKIRKIDQHTRREWVEKLLQEMNLEAIRSQRADTLSGGELQKVALARALAAQPRLLLLDETTANIHKDATIAIERQLQKYHRQTHCTIIFVTHNIAQAERFCHHCIHLE